MFCPKCGKQIPEGARFCGGCGNPVQMITGAAGHGSSAGKPPKAPKPPKTPKAPKAPKASKQPVQSAVPTPQPPIQSAIPAPQQPAQSAIPTPQQPVQSAPAQQQSAQSQSAEASDATLLLSPQPVVQQPVSMPAVNLPSDVAMTQKTRDEERKNRKLTIILCVVLFVLVLVAVGMGVYYFKVLRDGDSTEPETIEEVSEQSEETEGDTPEAEEDSVESEESEKQETEEPAEQEDEGVVSDTNEVVADKILENIPKAVYSYRFNENLGNAEVVVRNAPDTEPEKADDIEPQYVRGIDGEAVYLDGTYGIKLDDVERVGNSYTVAFWMKADELHDWSPFIHIGHDLSDSDKRVRLWLGQKTDGVSVAPIISSERAATGDSYEVRPGQSKPNTISPNVWYHIVFTVDASRQGSRSGSVVGTLYVAGQYIGEGDIVLDTMNEDNFDVYLGINRWDELYPVAFDDVKIWDQVLDSGQVQELYHAYD